MYIPIESGKKIAMPRYYKDKIYTEIERKKIGAFQLQRITEELEKQPEKTNIEKHNEIQSHLNKFKKMSKDAKQRDKL